MDSSGIEMALNGWGRKEGHVEHNHTIHGNLNSISKPVFLPSECLGEQV